jgi:phenylacetate-coenzyme A ligase PaaK-like adenylate-forming protein
MLIIKGANLFPSDVEAIIARRVEDRRSGVWG